ncbi:ParB/RepB/Spo0J family partition protein [Sphingomonas sp. Leaf4]|uniref:ParB/RepB/Spo0J family partition protein n=1 Tax=Sphingomonas sp. Leaf4 TaxID=2876553 RepID=UPI001E3EEDAF|nr:ParB/RepB/Spo0J family partition protein [Sphingomonas sp. Leaf4]
MIQSVKLSKLRPSEKNVRKTGEDLIERMMASVMANGILQNLLVAPLTKPRGCFAVIGGSRRYRALMLAVERGLIVAEDYDVPIKVLNGDDAALSEMSTVENFERLDMSPADECRAFQHFLGDSGDIEAVAKRFGVTTRFIEGRLRLAGLAEPIFDALASGTISLDMAKAYASTGSHERQLAVWEGYGRNSYANADTVRRVIANEALRANEPVALLVGADAYVAAGGRIDRDFFSEGGDKWIDTEIAQRLAAATMEAEAKRIGAETGLAWIRPIAAMSSWEAAREVHRVHLPRQPMSDEARARMNEIDLRIDTIAGEMNGEDVEETRWEGLETEIKALTAEREIVAACPRILPDELRTRLGTFLTLSQDGKMRLDDGYYSETPLRVHAVTQEAQNGEQDGQDDDDTAPTGDETTAAPTWRIEEGPVSPDKTASVDPVAAAPGGKALSQTLQDQLSVQRRDVLGAALLANPTLALDYALFMMADGRETGGARSGSSIRAGLPQDPVARSAMPSSPGAVLLDEARAGLDAAWCEHHSDLDRFEAFRALDDGAKLGWMAWLVATSLEAKEGYSTKRNRLHARLATHLNLDVAAWWRPTSENFFDRVPKGSLITLLHDVGGPALSSRHAAAKKPEISASCHKLFSGEAIVEADVKHAALAWVPAAMRFDDTAIVGDDDLPVPDDLLADDLDLPADIYLMGEDLLLDADDAGLAAIDEEGVAANDHHDHGYEAVAAE